jgi:pyridoxamine 5'-phosphate oxidase
MENASRSTPTRGRIVNAPWRKLLDASLAAHDDDPTPRYVALASNGLDRAPACRMLVFRGFAADCDGLLFSTDARSLKVREISRDARAEVCWYFPRTREQYRLAGSVYLVREGTSFRSSRIAVWESLSQSVRKQFSWPSPGTDWISTQETAPIDDSSRSDEPPPTFAVLRLFPYSRVDYLNLRTDPPERIVYEYTSGMSLINTILLRLRPGRWTSRRVNP